LVARERAAMIPARPERPSRFGGAPEPARRGPARPAQSRRIAAITMPASTKITISTCVQIQKGDISARG
jgi:hypothetical protein